MIVVGGGPAGSLAALLLARGGAAVQLVEQHRFPRDKVCGECLSALGIDVLGRACLTAPLAALGPVELVRTLIHPTDGPSIELPLPRAMWGVTRLEMDRVLLSSAVDAGVTVHQPARCERVVPGVRPSVTWRDTASNCLTDTAADWVIIADGKSAVLPPQPPPTGDLGIKTHFTAVDGPTDAIELFGGNGCYGGLAAVNGNLWNAAFAVPAELIHRCRGDLTRAFGFIRKSNPALSHRLNVAEQRGRWLASPLPRFAVAPCWPTGVIPIGNAAAALEPVGGEGMGLALRSAELAAQALLSSNPVSKVGVNALSSQFRQLWKVRRAVCRGVGRAVADPTTTSLIQPFLSLHPGLVRNVSRWAGKAAT